MERLRIAVLTSHAAQIRPDDPRFMGFFSLLDALGDRVDFAAECDAMVIGGPLEPLPPEVIAAVRAAVDRGVRLLILSHMGGDELPLGRHGAKTNLSALCDHFVFEQTVLHYPSGMWGAENTELSFDARGETFPLSAAGSIALSPHAEVLASYSANATIGRAERRDDEFPDVVSGEVLAKEPAIVLARVRQGRGTITAFSGALSLRTGPTPLMRLVVSEWLSDVELARRLQRTQRHRLLHGYPMSPLGTPTEPYDEIWAGAHRELIAGILPHAFCNPTVKGCGFCAFPHDPLDKARMSEVVKKVIADVAEYPGTQRRATALYFGGATANLTPPPLLDELCAAAAKKFAPGEVTLEGVPKYFLIDQARCLDSIAAHFPGKRRISMGVQTFDELQLKAMGRAGFGDRKTFADVTAAAHARGFSVSADFLINLPGQTREAVLRDVDDAAALGLDQICLYHLVLGPQLDVPWAKDRRKLELLPSNPAACETWRAARERLLELGFEQRTLTNFARGDAFLYEEQGFIVEAHDTLGFGPASITRAANASFRAGAKIERPTSALDFLNGRGFRRFAYGERDMQILFVTRGLARLRVSGATFRRLFDVTLQEAFGPEIAAAVEARLVVVDGEDLTLTPAGMFYSDSVAGVIAWARVGELRMRPVALAPLKGDEDWLRFRDANDATYGGMG